MPAKYRIRSNINKSTAEQWKRYSQAELDRYGPSYPEILELISGKREGDPLPGPQKTKVQAKEAASGDSGQGSSNVSSVSSNQGQEGSYDSVSSGSSNFQSSAGYQPSDTPSSSSIGSSQTNTNPSPDSSQDIEMPLTGTGKGMAEGGASSQGEPVYQIARPISHFGKKISTYTKSHKFMIFGLANAVIGPAVGANRVGRLLTTSLAEVPWQKLPLYMNQSEFDLLPRGTRAVEMEVEVYFRGNRIAFETAASTSGLATLNQIVNVQVGYALNKTGWGLDRFFTTFNNDQPMLPTAAAAPRYDATGSGATAYRGMVADYYGVNNDDTNFGAQGFYPHHQTASFTFLRNYFCMYSRSPGTGAGQTGGPLGGWPCLAEKIEQYDGKTVINQCIAKMNYKPRSAPLKTPHGTIPIGYPGTGGVVQTNGHISNMNNATVTISDTDQDTGGVSGAFSTATRVAIPSLDIYTDIEKSQTYRSGYWGQSDAHIQPSLHVGVQAVPALTTAALSGPLNQWTDSMGYIDVIARLVVVDETPTAFPYAITPNVPPGEVMLRNNQSPNSNSLNSTIAGLYPTTATLGTL